VINASEAIGSRSGVLALSTGVARVDSEYLKGFRPDASPAPGDYVYIEVSDNGCGMDTATLAKIFDPFFTTKFTGRGLGLAAVLGIVRGHKGGLKVYSEPGRGTTFKLFFPVATGRAQESANPFPNAVPFQGSGVVLVVDDEETVRTVAARMLERMGFSVVLAADGREGMEKFRGEPNRFTLVLLDLTMPHLDGEETFRQMRQLNPGVRVILTSGFNQQDAVNRFTGKGLAGFIQKPFELTSLVQVVRSVLPHG
jgi:CheY-like chemotaxis protein